MFRKFFDYVYENQFLTITIILVAVSVMILFQNNQSNVNNVKLNFIDAMFSVKKPIIDYKQLLKASKENQILRKKIIKLNVKAINYQNLEEENNRLRDILEFKRQSNFKLIPALILSKGVNKNINRIIIDKGEDNNIEKNDVIVVPEGIVGKVIAVNKRTSLVQLITDLNFFISARIIPSDAKGILCWYGGNEFVIKDIPNSILVKEGDRVVTSGFSDIFPPMISIGTIGDVKNSPNGFTYILKGKLCVDFYKIGEVLVLKK